ncbi:MAG: plasmid stabilization system [Gammaproteobacteria bacterium]|jgi:toxin ParE1/3/4|nr:plasmid stabilization system [Gammaproteobacteria bacterium]
MSQYKFTGESQQDLIQIRRFTLENWSSERSIHYLSDLRKTLQLLSEMPLMGKNCLDDLEKNVYRFPFGSHIIYYLTLSEKEIVIVAILHQSMVPGKPLAKRL